MVIVTCISEVSQMDYHTTSHSLPNPLFQSPSFGTPWNHACQAGKGSVLQITGSILNLPIIQSLKLDWDYRSLPSSRISFSAQSQDSIHSPNPTLPFCSCFLLHCWLRPRRVQNLMLSLQTLLHQHSFPGWAHPAPREYTSIDLCVMRHCIFPAWDSAWRTVGSR